MSDTIATAKKERIKILGRRWIDDFHQIVKDIKRHVTPSPSSSKKDASQVSFCLYPPVKNRHRLNDLLKRFNWYMPGLKENRYDLSVPISSKLHHLVEQTGRQSGMLDQIQFTNHSTPEIDEQTGQLLIHRFHLSLFFDPFFLKWIDQATIIDPYYYSYQSSSNYAQLEREATSDQTMKRFRRDANERFRTFISEVNSYSKSILFCTGPSVDQVFDMNADFPSYLTVICNSMVKNHDMLDLIQPDLLVFADPVFHFGYSEYARTFREEMVKTVRKYDPWIIIPLKQIPLFSAHFPDLSEKLIGMPLRPYQDDFHFPTSDEFYVYATNNILTRFMIPVASAMTDRIYLIGSDGRDPDEDYFWQHNPEVQFEGLKKTAFEAHPSFFRDRIYADYYDKHCEVLKKMIEHGEKKGKTYLSRTPSKIPVLKNRKTDQL